MELVEHPPPGLRGVVGDEQHLLTQYDDKYDDEYDDKYDDDDDSGDDKYDDDDDDEYEV